MAKLKVSGSASGTGTITLIAPATSTDRTITLPDESITLGGGVDGIVSTANATAITIDSSENVGINNSSPTTKLHIRATSTATESLITFDRSDEAVKGEIKYDDTAATRGFQFGTTTGHDIALKTNNTERLRLTYDGRGLSEFTVYCWLNYNGSSNSIRDSHNVSSVADWGTGDFGIYIGSGFGNSNYSAVGMSNDHRIMTCNTSNTAPQGGRFDFEVRDGGGTGVDRDYNFVQLVGSP